MPRFVDLFDETITRLFTIIAAIGALISLYPIFANFLLGSDWLKVLLSTQSGFLTLGLLLTASYAGLLFMAIILLFMMREFFIKISNDEHPDMEKVVISIIMLIGAVSMFSGVLFLSLIWLTKSDIALYYSIFTLALFLEYLMLLVIIYIIISGCTTSWLKYKINAAAIISSFILAILVFYLVLFPVTSYFFSTYSNYYSDKTIIVKIRPEVISEDNKTPVRLFLNKTTDAAFTKNISMFDLSYAQCHWTTNYGYFVAITSNNSVIEKEPQEFIVPGCGNITDKIFWTYNIDDFGKNKPPVIIGLAVEDQNKIVNNNLGDSRIILNWTGMDSIEIENNDSMIQSFF
jgi:NADH:ubiquinone oxidoreductase subunit 5 (subunit L)/multisubunit Na+/H+ antiporter MnhA subunit